MSEPKGKVDIIKVKDELKKYSKEQIIFNESHITQRCLLRDIPKDSVWHDYLFFLTIT